MNTESMRIGRRELLLAGFYALVLVWVNAYICRELFYVQTAYMNSMHGFWIALAKRAGGSWFHSEWWPYWDAGIPFEFTYPPLVPGLTAAWAAVQAIPEALALQRVTGVIYCLAPLTLFTAAWLLTRLPGCSFAAALFYSLTAPTQILVPDQNFSLKSFWDARRLFVVTVWDDTPHLAAIALLPLVILFLSLSIRRRRFGYYWAASALIALAALANAFGPVMTAIAAVCLLFVVRESLKESIVLIILIGALALAVSAPFYAPSLITAMRAASRSHFEPGWTLGSITALAIVVLAWTILWHFLRRWTAAWKLQFFALFALLTCSVPIIAAYLHRQFLLQPSRYKLEMELSLSLLFAFGLRPALAKLPAGPRRALLFLLLALAAEQTANLRQQAKNMLVPTDVTRTVEYRASTWVDRNLPGVRVMLPGSIAQWANDFSGVQQFSGSSWSTAYNSIQQIGLNSVYDGGGNETLPWLKAFGVGAVGISSPDSQEYWKSFLQPAKFEGVLPVLWRESGVTIYRIPQRSTSLAHVVPEAALVAHAPANGDDTMEIERYATALDDPLLPGAEFRWEGSNRIRIRAATLPGQAISIQVSYHPGWHARAGGHDRKLNRDGLGLMWLRPDCTGMCDVELNYNGGAELRICRWISYAAIAIWLAGIPFLKFAKNRLGASFH